ncbi:hypothetical protein [Embleya scabrispora]|uniref:hypothetical protein n=1 Tax=Embleya scabrispora TaxID=159449 RepID=UPI00036F7459|nr:hypothetical protein [Embleya scabrispora]MYS86667.1 hypothetical protein [Streptomyces sp. SID5474]
MSATRLRALGALGAATAATAVLAFAGTASAGGPVTATYNCLDTTLGTSYPGVSGTLSTSVTHKLRIQTNWNVPVFVQNLLYTTATLNSAGGPVTFAGGLNSNSPVEMGPLPKTSGTISPGAILSTPYATGPTPTIPGPTNWSLRIDFSAVSGMPGHYVYCALTGPPVSLAY